MVLTSNSNRRSGTTVALFIVAILFLAADVGLVLLALQTVV